MLLQVHDELVFDVHNSELEKIQPMIKHEMENWKFTSDHIARVADKNESMYGVEEEKEIFVDDIDYKVS